jgi:serine phosphatase RsbU (regulator of sigma subunit)
MAMAGVACLPGEWRPMPESDDQSTLLATLEHLLVLHDAGTVDAVLEALAEAACTATGSQRAMSGLSDGQAATATGWYDVDEGWIADQLRWEIGEGAPGRVLESGTPLVCNALPPTALGLDEATDVLGLELFACAPIVADEGGVLGFVEVGNKQVPYTADDVRCLSALGQHAALRLRVLAREAERAILAREQDAFCATQTEIAERLQALLLPSRAPLIEGAQIGILHRSSSAGAEIGGDFVDFCAFSPGLLTAAIGDVSGKGVEAAAVTVMTKYALRAVIAVNWPPRPGDVLAQVNNALSLQVEDMRFVTLILGLLDTKRRSFAFSSAGHPAPWILRRDHVERAIVLAEPAIAVQPTFDGSPYPTEIIDLAAGEAVLLFTDGIAEARNAAGEFYEDVRMQDALEELRELPAQRVVDLLYADAMSFAADGGQEPQALGDDVALVCLRLPSGDE